MLTFSPYALIAAFILLAATRALAQTSTAAAEHQRLPDLGNNAYLNPILPGDHPDPSILKDGDDYYLVNSSFLSYPGLLIWHSKDLVNWQPVGPALRKNVGSVWAPDITKINGKYFIYFPGVSPTKRSNYVVSADNINGPWSDPVDLHIGQIDPGHAVGPDGKRFLFLSGGIIVPLADDGLSTNGPLRKIYDGWKYPDDWIVESFSQEGPKITHHGDYYYMTLAEGGTAGPPTSHMVIEARAKSLDGPWENSPYNPIVHTQSRDEKWWSRGHATPVEGPGGKWYLVYHAYENGFYTLGRQTLLEPIVWTDDGWYKSAGNDVAKPIPFTPSAAPLPGGMAFSDDFSTDTIGTRWTFFNPADDYASRYRFDHNTLILKAQGSSPKDSPPLTLTVGDTSYQVDVDIEIADTAHAGLILFYNENLYAGLGFDHDHLLLHRYGTDRQESHPPTSRLHIRLVNDRNIVTLYTSPDGKEWSKFHTGLEVSGYHHNVAGGFLALKPALYAAGTGDVRFRDFHYQALTTSRATNP